MKRFSQQTFTARVVPLIQKSVRDFLRITEFEEIYYELSMGGGGGGYFNNRVTEGVPFDV